MSQESSHQCPRCGATLEGGSVDGLCANCLAALNFATETVMPGEGRIAHAPPLGVEELAPHFPQLEIIECLGRGGMGVVYKARQKSLNRLVALKLLAPERANDPQFAERFAREAQALAALNHPNIVAIYDFGQAGGFYFLLMEFVDGVNLRQLLQAKKLTPKEALSIVPPVCDALQCAHDHGIVHRDIKPENLLIDKAGTVKIADFGIAKMYGSHLAPRDEHCASADTNNSRSSEATPSDVSPQLDSRSESATLFGTPDYAAPEQHDAHAALDHRADIYSLGVVLYEMLTGERPQQNIVPPSKRVQVDVRIDEIVLRALEKTPELRFATAAEFRTQIDTAMSSEMPPRIHPVARRPMLWPGITIMLAGLALLLLAEPLNEFVDDLGVTQNARKHLDIRRLVIEAKQQAKDAEVAKLHQLAEAKKANDEAEVERLSKEHQQLQNQTERIEHKLNLAGERKSADERVRVAQFQLVARGLIAAGAVIFLFAILRRRHTAAWRAKADLIPNVPNTPTGASRPEQPLSGTQRFFQRWMPAHWFENMRSESQAWHLVCECGHAKSYWDRGGIRYGAAGKPMKLMSCPACHQIKLHRTEWRGEGGPDNPAKGSLRAGAIVAAVWMVLAFAATGVVALVEFLRHGLHDTGIMWPLLLLVAAAPAITGILRGNWMRGFAISAFILALPCVLTAIFFVSAMNMESGGWHPSPSEAFMVPLSWIGTIFFPIAGVVLWHAGRPSGRRMGCAGLAGMILIFVLILLLVIGGTLLLSYRQVSSAQAESRLAMEVKVDAEKEVLKQTAKRRDFTEQLQGTWKGTETGREGECTLTIEGNKVHFQGVDEQEWYRGTFEMVAGTEPQQFRATITECPFAEYIGKVSLAILAIDGDRLSFVGNEPGVPVAPPGFEGDGHSRHFVLQKVVDETAAEESPDARAAHALQMRWVAEAASAQTDEMEMRGTGTSERPLEKLPVEKEVLVDARHVKLVGVIASEASDKPGAPRIGLTLTDEGAARFAMLTRQGKGRRLALILGGQLWSAPVIRAEITGGVIEVSGNFSEAEAKTLADEIRSCVITSAKPTTTIQGTMKDDDLKKLTWQEFDQTRGKYWRELADVRRFKEAAELIEKKLSLHPELEPINASNLHFHAAQCWALAGEKEHALNQLKLARHSTVTTTGLRWNDYVDGTAAFLRGDKRELLSAHESLAKGDAINKPNLCVLDRLLAHFGKSYAEAYETDGQDHKKLSADCFNRAWELLEKKDRTKEDDERMISLAHESLGHWRMRDDCTDRNLSIGYWQLARVYAVLGQGINAWRYGELCLAVSGREPPFYLAYAHEALARAALLNKRRELFDQHLAEAHALATKVEDADERKMLDDDLAGLVWK